MYAPLTFALIAAGLGFVSAQDNTGVSGKIQFAGVGYDSTFKPVKRIKDGEGEGCYCELSTSEKWFSGVNAPFNGPLAVHIRSPVNLTKFAHYISDDFVIGADNSSGWSRGAYFDYSTDVPHMENVTFLGHVGDTSECLGKSLGFIGADGVTKTKGNYPPAKYLNITDGVEYLLYSNTTCPKSKIANGCGVYRKGVKAFYGFDGATKMFLFEFTMPTYRAPAANSPSIWLSTDSLPRVTENYFNDTACSCISQGCGALNLFNANATHMNSSLITLQGQEDVEYADLIKGNVGDGYFERPTDTPVVGGVIFDSVGNVVTFIADNATFDPNLSAASVNEMLSSVPELGTTDHLKPGKLTAPKESFQWNAASTSKPGQIMLISAALVIAAVLF
ncbi:hypothetical protein DAKH74_047490 [Maudiozyma humilis]|uniref:glucan endo-1,3-beta-D-glucosidase n=1 Tax=Maudiozyma humilis TaxID=51915 RepID=A0AAV5S3Q5_MAUHU|nr:hypothetical protein DAKH74_047490 [Kazachstania humilis]